MKSLDGSLSDNELVMSSCSECHLMKKLYGRFGDRAVKSEEKKIRDGVGKRPEPGFQILSL